VDPRLASGTLADRYDILELLGTGGMGEVYRARDRELDELVALKVIRADLADEPALVERFRHEVKLARRVTHANVARTFELGHADGVVFCTMELIEGESLARRLASRRVLPAAEAVAIASAVCEGLAAAHAAGVVHRDIKPDNVLIASDGRVVVADFGVAAIGASDELSGTPAYMAPEQARREPPSPATDVYAVGVVLYEMLTGQRGFGGDLATILADKQQIERLIPSATELPVELADVVGRATARDVAARIPTADALRKALAPWTRTQRPPTAPHRAPIDPTDLHQVIVLPPRGGADASRLYLATAVHAELLRRLSRQPRVRVKPRVEAIGDPGSFVVSLDAADALAITMTRIGDDAPVLSLRVPLAIGQVAGAADAAVRAIVGTFALDVPVSIDPVTLANDLVLRARHLVQHNVADTGVAVELLERAVELAPNDPRVAAAFAMARARRVFFVAGTDPNELVLAAELAHAAVAAAPELAEAHIAMGHVELHTGDPGVAAGHFRVAIACSPHAAEAHEYLGRLLIEAGFFDEARARIEDAVAIAPKLTSARWELARALALDEKWDEHDRLVESLIQDRLDRALTRTRFAWWRGDRARLLETRALLDEKPVFDAELISGLLATICDGAWSAHRDRMMTRARDTTMPDLRRRAFIAQLVAEAAGAAGDSAACIELLELADASGLFDLHWLDRCRMIAIIRGTPAFASVRARVKTRAESILDALYGDHRVALSETQLASSVSI
jgi:serine/threonine-protein kinase